MRLALTATMAVCQASVLSATPVIPANGGFVPPADRMQLTRELRRPLTNGDEIVSRRTYEVRFVRDGDGFIVDGQLVDVVVEVPEKLAKLGDLERKRLDTGMFPLHLDSEGYLVSAGERQPDAAVAASVEFVSRQLGQLRLNAFDLEHARTFARQFLGGSGYTQWPQDLFHPMPGRRRETRTMPIEGSVPGEVSVEIEARTDAGSGMMRSFTRSVTTRVGETAQVTRESWTLFK